MAGTKITALRWEPQYVAIYKCYRKGEKAKELFRQVEDAIVEQTKKGALYPYFYQGRFDDTTIRVFDERGETQYWLDFLELGERVSEHVPLQRAVIEQLPDELVGKYAEPFEALSLVRPLVDKERLIEAEDRLPTSAIRALNREITSKAGEQKVTLWLDKVRVEALLSQYGHTWILAEEEGQTYFLAKGLKLESHTKMLTPLDLAEFPSLKEAAAELDIQCR